MLLFVTTLTNEIGFVLLEYEAIAGVGGAEGGGGGAPSAVGALCSAALAAVQGPACVKTCLSITNLGVMTSGYKQGQGSPGPKCRTRRTRNFSLCKMCIFTEIYCCRLIVLV